PLLQIEAKHPPTERLPELSLLTQLASGGNANTGTRWNEDLRELKRLMLGFDVDPGLTAKRFVQWKENPPIDSVELRQFENEILSIFVDIQSLFCRHPEPESSASAEVPSAEMSLFTFLSYLRSNEDTRHEELPPAVITALRKVLCYYGVYSLNRAPALEESLFWIYKSHQRSEQQVGPVLQILDRILSDEAVAARAEASFHALLDRLISVTRESFPLVSQLAREVRYRYFDQPLFESIRQQTFEQVEGQLSSMTAETNPAIRRERVRDLMECPQPLVSLFAPRFANATPAMCELMLEVLTWRYYRIRNLAEFGPLMVGEHRFMKGEYDHEGKRIHVFTTHAEFAQLAATAQMIFPQLQKVPADHDIVLDFYLWNGEALGAPEEMQQKVAALLNQAAFPRAIRRIVVAVGGPGKNVSEMQHFTYRPREGSYEEEKLYRGLHPMIGKRLHLWRLNNFEIERLPSVDEVYLLRGVARDNPKDERLFACAEVRDVTPVRDSSGRIVQLPYLERMLSEAIAAIRTYQSRRSPHERLYWNRILLYVWPPLEMKPDELHDIVQKLVPEAEGAGLEQVVVRARIPNPETGELRDMVVRLSSPGGSGLLITFRPAA